MKKPVQRTTDEYVIVNKDLSSTYGWQLVRVNNVSCLYVIKL